MLGAESTRTLRHHREVAVVLLAATAAIAHADVRTDAHPARRTAGYVSVLLGLCRRSGLPRHARRARRAHARHDAVATTTDHAPIGTRCRRSRTPSATSTMPAAKAYAPITTRPRGRRSADSRTAARPA